MTREKRVNAFLSESYSPRIPDLDSLHFPCRKANTKHSNVVRTETSITDAVRALPSSTWFSAFCKWLSILLCRLTSAFYIWMSVYESRSFVMLELLGDKIPVDRMIIHTKSAFFPCCLLLFHGFYPLFHRKYCWVCRTGATCGNSWLVRQRTTIQRWLNRVLLLWCKCKLGCETGFC